MAEDTRRAGPLIERAPPPPSSAPAGPKKATPASDSLRRAAERAAELSERTDNQGDGQDIYRIDPAIVPDGWTYEFKRYTLWGQQDPTYQVQIAQAGWQPVPAARHPELMPPGYEGNTILVRGQMLVEIPTAIYERLQSRDRRNAHELVSTRAQALKEAPDGTGPRSAVTLKESYSPFVPPKSALVSPAE